MRPQSQQPQGCIQREQASARVTLAVGAQQPVTRITAVELRRVAWPQAPGSYPLLMPRVLHLTMRDAPGGQEGLLGVRQLDLRSIDESMVIAAPPASLDDGPGYREPCAAVVSPALHAGEWMSLDQEGLFLQRVHLRCAPWRQDVTPDAVALHRESS